MEKTLWRWEKHDVVNYLRANFEENVEFTTESLIKKIKKSKVDYYYFGYEDNIISNHLFNLVSDGYLTVRYISIKAEVNTDLDSTKNSANYKNRTGSKTLSIFKIK